MPRFLLALAATCVVLSSPALFAQANKTAGPAPAAPPTTSAEVLALLDQARKSIADLKAMSYTAQVEGGGTLVDKVPSVKADVSASRAEAGGWKLYTKGASTGADSKTSFEVSYDGVIAYSNKEKDQTIYEKEPGNEGELAVFFSGQGAKHPIAWEVISERPFDLNGGHALLEDANSTVGDVPCRVILLNPKPLDANGGDTETQSVRVWLSKDDGIPRKIERLLANPAGGTRILTITNLRKNENSIGAPYTMQVPDGYAVKSPDPKPEKKAAPKRGGGGGQPAAPPGALAIGDVAPEFALKDADGKEHKLSEYKGKIVLLDFWATWCGPCRMAMPGVQKIHDKFKGKPVVVIGMNTSENKDPVAYMKEKKFTYGLLLNAETIGDKYNIAGIPAFFLIGPDGKLLWQEVGYNPQGEKEATDIIEKTLKGMEK